MSRGSILVAAFLLSLANTNAMGVVDIDLKGVLGINLESSVASYRGRDAVRLVEKPASPVLARGETIAIVPGVDFKDGIIDIDVAAELAPTAARDARGFIGLAFDVAGDGGRLKAFYIRPTNGRANDQLRRNHATQYISHPEHTWQRLRTEEPGVYESYADMELGEWTHLRIVVEGTRATLHVNGAAQPTLVVNDLKHPQRGGSVALWQGLGTIGYFANLRVEHRPAPPSGTASSSRGR